MEEKKVKSQAQRWRDFVEVVFWTFCVAVLLRIFFLGFYRVSTASMAPSLRVGDFVWVSKASYGLRIPFVRFRLFEKLPHKGDLVLFRFPDQPNTVHIKRVIGLPGDHVHIKKQQIIVNDQPYSLEPQSPGNFTDLPGADFMRFYRESNGKNSYDVMFAQNPESTKEIGPLVVPPGEIFVMGDNRDASDDSRYWGAVPMTHVEAKMKGIWFSLVKSLSGQEAKGQIRWDRIRFEF